MELISNTRKRRSKLFLLNSLPCLELHIRRLHSNTVPYPMVLCNIQGSQGAWPFLTFLSLWCYAMFKDLEEPWDACGITVHFQRKIVLNVASKEDRGMVIFIIIIDLAGPIGVQGRHAFWNPFPVPCHRFGYFSARPPALFLSFLTVLVQVVFGLPLALRPSVVHPNGVK